MANTLVRSGTTEVCVAVLDGPVDLTHPCLAGSAIETVGDDTLRPGTYDPAAAHGTAVASIIFGQPGTVVKGVAPGSRGLVIPVFATGPDGVLQPAEQSALARAIDIAVERGADVINISAGQLEPSGVAEPALAEAARHARESGVIVVAAAGNDGCDCLHVPAALPDVIAVGALDRAGVPLDISNWGQGYLGHAVMAPGQDIPVAMPEGGVATRSGTSYAAAIVSGTAALLLSEFRTRAIPADAEWVRAALLDAGEPRAEPSNGDPHHWIGSRLAVDAIPSRTVTERNLPMSDSTVVAGSVTEAVDQASAAPSTAAPSAPPVRGIALAGATDAGACGCACGSNPPQIAYVLSELGQDFVSESRRDAYTQHFNTNVHDANALIALVDRDLSAAAGITWTLNLELTPIYAIQPAGPFASDAYRRVVEFFKEQVAGRAERVCVPGYVTGSTVLMSGLTVPVLVPELRGMYSWTTAALVQSVLGEAPTTAAERRAYEARRQDLQNFLDRVYFELRNLGLSSQERALNYAATNAFQTDQVFRSAMASDLKLDTIEVERSPIGRPGTDCWDVKLTFFHPAHRLDQARQVYRFTVDVSDVVPVTIGRIRSWQVY
jgi:PatG C-terminal/Subtilase family